MKIVIDYNGSVAKCLVDGKPISDCDILTRTMALGSFGTIKKHLERENLDLGKISPKYLDYIKSWLDYIKEGNRASLDAEVDKFMEAFISEFPDCNSFDLITIHQVFMLGYSFGKYDEK